MAACHCHSFVITNTVYALPLPYKEGVLGNMKEVGAQRQPSLIVCATLIDRLT